MNSSLQKFQAWRSRRKHLREQRWLEYWTRIRAEGKTRFVLEGALTYGLTIVGAGDVYDWIFHGIHSLSLSGLIGRLLIGIPVALILWSSMESQYRKALNKAQIKASLMSQSPSGSQ